MHLYIYPYIAFSLYYSRYNSRKKLQSRIHISISNVQRYNETKKALTRGRTDHFSFF